MMKSVGNFFVRLGSALMLPIAVLPIAGLLLRLGQADLLDIKEIAAAGDSIFSNLPLIFAIGVAIGFAKDKHGSAALSAFVGHAIFMASLKVLAPEANMGVLSGILIGVIAGGLYNRYRTIQLPTYLAFFGGSRFIPIITGITGLVLAYVAYVVWPPIEHVISSLGDWIIASDNIGLFTYGFANRLLIPVGLHHILNSLVWFQFGDYAVIENGKEVLKHGDLWRFYAGDKTAGAFMTGFFPVMMFGLPGAALAMIVTAKKAKRKIVSGILISAAITSFLTGITEPIEFSFIFVAFPLYIIHALLTGFSEVIMNMLDVRLGFTFSAGAFDYILSYGLGENGWLLMPVGVGYFFVYFFIFFFAIKLFKFKTLGREDDTTHEAQDSPVASTQNDSTQRYITALGGKDNITNITSCATRLRLEVKDNTLIDEPALKALGAKGVLKDVAGVVQVIIGPEVEHIAEQIKQAV